MPGTLGGARKFAVHCLVLSAVAGIIVMSLAQFIRGESDPTFGFAVTQYILGFAVPAAMYVASSVRIANKKTAADATENPFVALLCVVLGILCIAVVIWLIVTCFKKFNIEVRIDEKTSQTQLGWYPLQKTMDIVGTFYFPFIAFLLTLDVFDATKTVPPHI